MFVILARRSVILFSVTLALVLFLSSPVNAKVYDNISFLDANTGFLISKLNEAKEIDLPLHKKISVKVTPTKSTDKMRLEALDNSSKDACQFERINGRVNTTSSGSQYFIFNFEPKESAASCALRAVGWGNTWKWLGQNKFKINFSNGQEAADKNIPVDKNISADKNISNSESKIYAFTAGTDDKSEMILGSITKRSNHGVRIYCPVSHFSYDDPIIYPNQPGLAHLHMFVGNSSADAYSTPTSLLKSGNSSCEGGTNVRSSYWTPAVFNGKDELVLPEKEFVYYKTFMGRGLDYNKIQKIPNGLEMLAQKSTLNANENNFVAKYTTKDGTKSLLLDITFPSCLATKNGQWNGTPILSYKDMPGDRAKIVNSHVAYPGGPDKNLVGCPASHPYRTPTMSLKIYYDQANLTSGWYLSSDIDKSRPGSTLHGDYIAAWDPETMERITKCNIEARSCDFTGGRRQLSERFTAPNGKKLYKYSAVLESDVDRTPFGDLLKPRPTNAD